MPIDLMRQWDWSFAADPALLPLSVEDLDQVTQQATRRSATLSMWLAARPDADPAQAIQQWTARHNTRIPPRNILAAFLANHRSPRVWEELLLTPDDLVANSRRSSPWHMENLLLAHPDCPTSVLKQVWRRNIELVPGYSELPDFELWDRVVNQIPDDAIAQVDREAVLYDATQRSISDSQLGATEPANRVLAVAAPLSSLLQRIPDEETLDYLVDHLTKIPLATPSIDIESPLAFFENRSARKASLAMGIMMNEHASATARTKILHFIEDVHSPDTHATSPYLGAIYGNCNLLDTDLYLPRIIEHSDKAPYKYVWMNKHPRMQDLKTVLAFSAP
jgi:hypothetical protein